MPTRPATRLFLDWDGTITCTDTLSTIAAIGYGKPSAQKLPAWSHFGDAYKADVAAHTASYEPQEADRRSLSQELAWLGSLVDVERASVERVEAAGVFAGVTAGDVRLAAAESAARELVRVRPGLKDLLQVVREGRGSVEVISVGWSGAFIAEFLGTAVPMDPSGWPVKAVYANEIEPGLSTRLDRHFANEDRGIWTAQDKSRVLREVLAEHVRGMMTVYVGDSLTDLDCLLIADVGICIRDEPMGSEQRALAEALNRLRIACKPIDEHHLPIKHDGEPSKTHERTLWWARDFMDVAGSALFSE